MGPEASPVWRYGPLPRERDRPMAEPGHHRPRCRASMITQTNDRRGLPRGPRRHRRAPVPGVHEGPPPHPAPGFSGLVLGVDVVHRVPPVGQGPSCRYQSSANVDPIGRVALGNQPAVAIPLDTLAPNPDTSRERFEGGQGHRATRHLLAPPAEGLVEFGRVDAMQPHHYAGNDDGVAVDDLGRAD